MILSSTLDFRGAAKRACRGRRAHAAPNINDLADILLR
jgi:hypothetical protein